MLRVRLRPTETYDPLSQSAIDDRNTSSVSSGPFQPSHPPKEPVLHDNMSHSNPTLSGPRLPALKRELAEICASLAEATCWRASLYNELQSTEAELKVLVKLQRKLLIEEAELMGRIQKVGRISAPKSTIATTTRVEGLFHDLNAQDKEDLVASLLKELTKNLTHGA